MLLTTTRRQSTRRSAFTLLEVLVVVAILVILATVATIATTRYIDDARKSKAHLTAKGIEQAIDAYFNNNANPYAGMAPDGYPQAPLQLVQPPFGGQSFLKNGAEDLKDPWGKEFQWELATKADGTNYILVYTVAPDGTEISQFGIGPNARPKF